MKPAPANDRAYRALCADPAILRLSNRTLIADVRRRFRVGAMDALRIVQRAKLGRAA